MGCGGWGKEGVTGTLPPTLMCALTRVERPVRDLRSSLITHFKADAELSERAKEIGR